MDYIICIPSYDRSETLKTKTLNMLNDNNISIDKIKVYVVEEEYEKYKTLLPDYDIVKGVKGLVNQRRKIIEDNKGKNIVMIDDDIIE